MNVGGIGDLVSNLTMDTVEFVRPLIDAREHLKALADVATESFKKVDEAPRNAVRSWTEFGQQSVQSANSFGDAMAKAALPVGGLLSVIATRVPGLKVLSLWLTTLGAAYRKWGSESKTAATATVRAHKDIEQSSGLAAKATEQARDRMEPFVAMLGKRVVLAALAYRVGLDEVIQASMRHLGVNAEFRKSVTGLGGALSQLGATIVTEFTNGVRGSLMALVTATTGFTSLTEVVDYSARQVSGWASTATSAVKAVTEGVKEAGLVFGTALAIFQGMGDDEAVAFYREGKALNELAAQTEIVIQKQQALRDAFDYINASAGKAASGQKIAAEIARIGTVETVEALDEELRALKRQQEQVDAGTRMTKAWKQEMDQITAAIERRRAALENPPKDDFAAKQIESAHQALMRLTLGETGYAVAMAQAHGASAEQIQMLHSKLTSVEQITQAQTAQKAAEQAIQSAQEQANQRYETGAERIASMHDQIDLLTGKATKAMVAMRELSRQGFDEAQIAEIGRLQAELDKLDATKKSGPTANSQADNKAALQGSAEAAQLVLRGVGSSNGSVAGKQLAEQQKGNAIAQQTLGAVKALKSPQLKAAKV